MAYKKITPYHAGSNNTNLTKVGIATDDPQHNLDVEGSIGSRQVRHSIRPTLNLDFANSKQLDPRISFYRDSIATYYDANGTLRYSTKNKPRFDHDPATGESKGLLIEEERLNRVTHTDIDATAWGVQSVSLEVKAALAPDGTMSATRIRETDSPSNYFHFASVPASQPTGPVAFSCYLKAGGATTASLFLTQGGNNYALFDLENGTVSTVLGTGNTASIQDVGNGWYRCVVKNDAVAANTASGFRIGIQNGAGNGYVGDPDNYIYAWGPQVESGNFATSYVPSNVMFASRSSRATYYDENGIIRIAPAGSPRNTYAYDGRKWVEAGILFENSGTNFEYDNIYGYHNGAGAGTQIDSITELAPDGTYTATKFSTTVSSGNRTFSAGAKYLNLTGGTIYTYSAYVKNVNMTGWSTSFPSNSGATITILRRKNSTISELSTTEWRRVEITFLLGGTGTQTVWVQDFRDGGTGSAIMWGKQIEQGHVATSLIYNNTSSSITRSADIPSNITTTRAGDYAVGYDLDSLLPDVNKDGLDFTLYGDLQGIGHNDGFQQAIYLEDTLDSGNMYVALFSAYDGNNTISSSYNINGVSRNFGNWTTNRDDISLRWKIAMGIKENDSRAAANGVLGSAAAGYWNGGGTFDRFYIGNGYQGGRYFNGWIRKLSYYDKRLANDELTSLTENN